MAGMTSQERFRRMFEHREADRIPIFDDPWVATIERWQGEGLPVGADVRDALGMDHFYRIGVDNSPRYPTRIVEETEEYRTEVSEWGTTLKTWKHMGGVPEFIDFTIVSPETWAAAKARMTPTSDRIDWAWYKKNYPVLRNKGAWLEATFWFGFDVTHAWIVGTERLLMALVEQPEWCVDMWNTQLDMDIALYEQVWDAGYKFDCINWPDDLGYKLNQFMSVKMYRELLKPVMKRAVDWAHSRGVKVRLHSCGDVRPFVPEFVDIGIDCLHPLEVKAGMDAIAVKKQFGDKLVLHGGINAVLWDDFEAMSSEMTRVIPVLKQNGGYIFCSDHSVPSSVSLEEFKRTIELAKQLGSYE